MSFLMECKQNLTILCLLFFIVNSHGTSEPEIISTQVEVITYLNHTAKLSCIVQNRNREHVTWSRVTFDNDTLKLTDLLYVNTMKYTPFGRYHLMHSIDEDQREYWNLEIRHVHPSDQGYYSCVLTANKPISKLFYVKVIENLRNPALALRSTSDVQRRANDKNSSPSIQTSLWTMSLILSFVLPF